MDAAQDAPKPNREAPPGESNHHHGCAEHEEHHHDLKKSSAARLWGSLRTAFHGSYVRNHCCHGDHIHSHDHFDFGKNFAEQDTGEKDSAVEVDVERGPVEYESVKYSVQGMTCSGCELNLQRALSKLLNIHNPKIDSVRGELQFEVDRAILSPEQAVRKLKGLTAFEFTKLEQIDGVYLDVRIDDWESFERRPRPDGVLELYRLPGSEVEKRSVRIRYDPTQVYPRDLLQQGYGLQDVHLDPVPIEVAALNDKRHIRKEAGYTIASAILTVPILVFAWAPMPGPPLPYNVAALVLATIVQVFIAWEFYPSAFKTLFRNKTIEMDLLIVMSTSIAYLFSVISFAYSMRGIMISSGPFFETSALLITLIRMGRFFCALARRKANEAVSIQSLQPTSALLVDPHNTYSPIGEIDVRLLQPGDIFEVRAGSRIPTDGEVVHGSGRVDESSMTGESDWPTKGNGKQVIAGTMVKSGMLRIEADRLVCKNRISEISRLMKETDLSKTRVQDIADRVAGIFVPLILALSCVVFLVWLLFGMYGQRPSLSASESAIAAITYAVSTLIVSCPCAIGLAVPMVVVIAQGIAVRHHLVFRAPSVLQTARKTTHVIFDKTGTLTGDFTVSHARYFDKVASRERIDSLLAGLILDSNHPVDRALNVYLADSDPAAYSNITMQIGHGVIGQSDGEIVQIGSYKWLGLHEPAREPSELARSFTAMKINDKLCAEFQLQTAICPEARDVIAKLRSRHINVEILSGDSAISTKSIADELDVGFDAGQTPEKKLERIAGLQNNRKAVVMFVGDGTNDALALKQADIGVHVKGGTDIALSAADIVLTESDLWGILVAIDISAAAMRRIKFNFIWSAVYNVLAVLLAAGAFTALDGRVSIPPAFAGLGELVSVLPVILVAFSLTFVHFRVRG